MNKPTLTWTLIVLLVAAASAAIAEDGSFDERTDSVIDQAEPENWLTSVENLRSIDSPVLSKARIDQLVQNIQSGQRNENDDNLLCIGALSVPFAAAFGVGLVPNPPWDYLLGQVPAYAANLALKFCPPVLEAPDARGVHPNVNTDDGLSCAYDFSQPVIAATRSDFMGLPLSILGNWTFTSTQDSVGLGTPSVFHYNTDVSVRMILPGEAPSGFVQQVPDPEFVAEIGPFGIRAPDNELFTTIGCLLDGSIPFNNEGGPCPIDLDRKIRLPVGTHTIFWRAETELGLLDTLPPIYVPGKPPGSKKEAAKAVLKNIYEAAAGSVAGSFLESYPTGVVNLETQVVRVFDTTDPVLGFTSPELQTFRVEAQEPGGQSTNAFRGALRDSVVATDACNRSPTVTAPIPPFLPLGSHTIIWTARDQGPSPSGGVNEETIAQTVIIEDTQPPQILPPPSIVIESDFAPITVDTGSPQIFDVVDLEPMIEFDGPADFPFGVTVVRWRATDASGNSSPWVEQTINVKLTGSNNVPVADNASASGLSFDEIIVPLTGTDIDNDDLYFYIDEQPAEGFFVAPLLPTFVEDLRVEAQGDPGAICLDGGTLPPQNYVFLPEYITTNDDGVTFVIDRKVRCDDNSSTGINTDDARIARIGPNGELQAEYNLGSQRPLRLAFHPGGLPSAPAPFLYWLNPDSNPTRLLVVDQMLNGPQSSFVVDASGAQQSSPIDAAIDAKGIVYVTGTTEMDAYDFEGRDFDVLNYLGPVDPPGSELSRNFEDAWDMDVDSQGNVYIVDRDGHRIHKFGASTVDRSVSPSAFSAGEYIGWLGRCTGDIAPGDAAACDVASQRSIGYACKDNTCIASPNGTFGADPGQFDNPRGFAIDPNDILYVADRDNNRIQRFTPEGFFAGQARSDCDAVNCFIIGQFGIANDVAVNSSGFYVLDPNTEILHIFAADPVTMTGPDTGFVTYRSNNNFIGLDTFDWFASDGLRINGDLVRSNVATTTVDVAQNQRLPFATPGLTAQGIEDQPLDILLDGSDADIGDVYPWEPLQSLSATLIEQPDHGSVTINGLQATYVPVPDFNGSDEFQFAISDGLAVSAPEIVTIEMAPANDPPQLTPSSDPEDRIAGLGYPWELNVGVFDPDENDEHTLEIDWDDGEIENEGEIQNDGSVTGPLIDFNRSGDGVINARHEYLALGSRNAQVCVQDAIGAEACTSIPVQVVPMTDLAVFETQPVREVAEGQPVVYAIGMSNFEGLEGFGTVATGATLEVRLDPRLTFVSATGAPCTQSAGTVVCAIPDLNPIARGQTDGLPPVDRQVVITTLPDSALTIGSEIRSIAEITANPRNRHRSTQLEVQRFVVATADFIVSSNPADTPSANAGNGLCADADGRCSLRAAIEEAAALGGSRTIALSSSLYRLDQGPLQINSPVELIGLGISKTEVISDTAEHLFEVGPSGALTLKDLTLTSTEEVPAQGGLIRNQGNLLIEDALLQNGRASGGGALLNENQLTIRRSALINNQAVLGGGSGGAIFNSGDAVLENVLLFGNEARSGGAITSTPDSGATLILRDSTVFGNNASVLGAGLFGEFSSLPMATLERTILAGNTANNAGGGGVCWNQLLSAGDNLINDDLELCAFTPVGGDQVGVEPLLEPLIFGLDGRPVLEPRADSPATDALTQPCAAATDLRRLPRPQDGDGNGSFACDIGAFERGLASAIEVLPANLDFGAVAPGTASSEQPITLESSGNLALNVISIPTPPPPFQAMPGTCPIPPFSLAPGNSCTLSYRFVPIDNEPTRVEFTIVSNADQTAPVIELLGNVNRPELRLSEMALNFGDSPVGVATASQLVFADNIGNSSLSIGSIQITGPAAADFQIAPGSDQCSGQSVNPASSCGFGLRFIPTTEGIRRARVQIPSNDPESPDLIELSGTSDVVFADSFEDS